MNSVLLGNIISSGINDHLAMLQQLAHFLGESILGDAAKYVQRGFFDLSVGDKFVFAKLSFKPTEEKTIAKIEIGAVGALPDAGDSTAFKKFPDFSCRMWASIIHLPENFAEVNWLASQSAPLLSCVMDELDHVVCIHSVSIWQGFYRESFVWCEGDKEETLFVGESRPSDLTTWLIFLNPSAIF